MSPEAQKIVSAAAVGWLAYDVQKRYGLLPAIGVSLFGLFLLRK